MKNIKILEKIYLSLIILILVFIILTPLIISEGISVISEEPLEAFIITILFLVGFFVRKVYQNEAEKNRNDYERLKSEKIIIEESLTDAFRHIGSINVQIDEIRASFSDIKKYPESKQDFKNILQFMGKRILGMTDADWALFRIIDVASGATLREYCETRGNAALLKHNFSNKDLLEGVTVKECVVAKSSQENFNIKTFCLVHSKTLNKDQITLITAIVNQLEMLFLIFTSSYYKNVNIDKKNE
jgi:hypothetical protein